MIEITALTFLTVFTFYYVYFITRVRIGLLNLKKNKLIGYYPFVSVIIAARNEEYFIGECIESLIHQTYPIDKYEIIIVDDYSTDNTVSILKRYSKQYSNVHIYLLSESENKSLTGKTSAISYGITKSIGEIIMTTDADCIINPKWIEIMTSYFEDDVAFVAGPVVELDNKNIFNKLESLELLGLITVAAGLIGSNRPIICNGANLSYRKNTFLTIGGFGNSNCMNDDESIMNRIMVRKIGKIKFVPEADAVALTRSSNSLKSFFKQRIRWANKRGHYEDKKILVSLVSLYLFFFSIFVTAILIPFYNQMMIPLSIVFAGKILLDYTTLRAGAKLFRQDLSILHFLIAELFHVPYIVIAAAIGQVGSLKWKGREI